MSEIFNTPVGLVKFYTLDAPFKETVAEFNEKGMVTNGKLTISILLDPTLQETKDILKVHKKNVSVKEVSVDGKAYVQLNAGTKFKVNASDADGRIIDAPADVRVNAGDVMKVALTVKPYSYTFDEIEKSALQLNAVKIIEHDKSNRTVAEGSSAESMIKALHESTTTDKLAKLKG